MYIDIFSFSFLYLFVILCLVMFKMLKVFVTNCNFVLLSKYSSKKTGNLKENGKNLTYIYQKILDLKSQSRLT